jgi:hypothetical protein
LYFAAILFFGILLILLASRISSEIALSALFSHPRIFEVNGAASGFYLRQGFNVSPFAFVISRCRTRKLPADGYALGSELGRCKRMNIIEYL